MPEVTSTERRFRRAIQDDSVSRGRTASWRLLEIAQPGRPVYSLGVVLIDQESDSLHVRLRVSASFPDLQEQEIDLLDALEEDLLRKGKELGAHAVLKSLEEFSGFLRSHDSTEVVIRGGAERTADYLFDKYVNGEVHPYMTHVPKYPKRAVATKIGESVDAVLDENVVEWVRVPRDVRLDRGMFAAKMVGRSMEPLIPEGSVCLFRTPVAASRENRLLLVELLAERDEAARYTVKKYMTVKRHSDTGELESEKIRLESPNPEFAAVEVGRDQFRVIAEFLQVL